MTYRKLFVCAFAAMGLVSAPLLATASARLTDSEVKALLENIENKRATFEASLDDKLKNSTIKSERGEVKVNEFFDDFQDQVQRARERFKSDYSASSEVLSLLQFGGRIEGWASTQPAGFKGSKEWGALATDLRRLASAYNTTLLTPGQQGLGNAQARRINDDELVTAAANVEKRIDAFRSAYDGALAANTALTPESRKSASPAGRHNEEQCEGAQRRIREQTEGHRGGGRAVEDDRGHDRHDVEAPTELPGGSGVDSASRRNGKSRVGL